jgi:hypothetical protein
MDGVRGQATSSRSVAGESEESGAALTQPQHLPPCPPQSTPDLLEQPSLRAPQGAELQQCSPPGPVAPSSGYAESATFRPIGRKYQTLIGVCSKLCVDNWGFDSRLCANRGLIERAESRVMAAEPAGKT